MHWPGPLRSTSGRRWVPRGAPETHGSSTLQRDIVDSFRRRVQMRANGIIRYARDLVETAVLMYEACGGRVRDRAAPRRPRPKRSTRWIHYPWTPRSPPLSTRRSESAVPGLEDG